MRHTIFLAARVAAVTVAVGIGLGNLSGCCCPCGFTSSGSGVDVTSRLRPELPPLAPGALGPDAGRSAARQLASSSTR